MKYLEKFSFTAAFILGLWSGYSLVVEKQDKELLLGKVARAPASPNFGNINHKKQLKSGGLGWPAQPWRFTEGLMENFDEEAFRRE